MTTLSIQRLTAVPATWEADTLYIVKSATAGLIDVYVTGTDAVPQHTISRSEILSLITAETSQLSRPVVVADIAARNALAPTKTTLALVLDATGDTSVGSGSALYIYDADSGAAAWTKVAEYESMDLQLTWSAITGGPSATPAAIDAAVSNAHSHANKATVDKLGEDASGLTYDGKPVNGGVVLKKAEW